MAQANRPSVLPRVNINNTLKWLILCFHVCRSFKFKTFFSVSLPLPCHVLNPTPVSFYVSTSNKVLLKTMLPSTQHEDFTTRTSSRCPRLLSQDETLDGVELDLLERILIRENPAFKPCLNIKCLSSVAWVRVVWIAVSKEQFHLTQVGEWIPLNKNFSVWSFAWSLRANFVNFLLLELLFPLRKSCWSHTDLTTKARTVQTR